MKKGLVLEGGAMRGMYTAACLDEFLEEEISFDRIVGVSAGALFGVNFLSGQKGRVIRYNKRFNHDKNYMGIRPLLREGNIVSTRYAYEKVPHELDPFDNRTFMQSNTEFYAVVTRMDTGKPEYVRIKSVFRQMDTLRASGSMPFVSKPVRLNGNDYLDGGISDSIPYEWLMRQGCEKTVVILTRDLTYRKKPMPEVLIRLVYHRWPKMADQLLRRHDVYNRQVEKLEKLEKEGRIFVIRPSAPIEIGRTETDPIRLQEVYDLGRKDAKEILPSLKAYLAL